MAINNRKWQEIEQDEIVQNIRKDIYKKKEHIWRGKLLGAYNYYLAQKKKGDYSYMVDEWDAFELERDRERIKELEKQNIKGEIKIMEKSVTIRLSKEFCNVEVGVEGILEVDDFVAQKEWAWNEAIEMVNRIPDGGFGKTTNVSKETYTKQHKPQQAHQPKPSKSYVTIEDINPQGFTMSKGQKGYAVKRINDKKDDLTLEQINSLTTYDQMQALLFNK